ncbi:Hypothetical protein NTJ_11818 [Nesidiocoris tenuis]|uniref:Protein TsetseEP domain-containing protein n=1 Tax=Nesidiocoris tenuis TaxID=355587 RepID=A0ABN7B5V2_9HEMI|nr:Hypothetical protein NTJ_11818 [Nesidiocoris tenuis]
MKIELKVFFLLALVAASAAFQVGSRDDRRKSINDMILKLGHIRDNIVSMKPTITTLAKMVDSLTSGQKTDQESAEAALADLNEKKIPPGCLQDATFKLSLAAEPVSNCSSLHIVEDSGEIMYNTANFIALAMLYLDEVDNGLSQCKPWYNIFHSIPCAISYAYTSFKYMTGIVGKAFAMFSANEELFMRIVDQIKCKQEEMFLSRSVPSTSEIINEAYLCAKAN